MAVLLGGASHYTFPDLQPQVNLQYYLRLPSILSQGIPSPSTRKQKGTK